MKMIRKALAVAIAGTALLAGTASAQNKPIEIQMWMAKQMARTNSTIEKAKSRPIRTPYAR